MSDTCSCTFFVINDIGSRCQCNVQKFHTDFIDLDEAIFMLGNSIKSYTLVNNTPIPWSGHPTAYVNFNGRTRPFILDPKSLNTRINTYHVPIPNPEITKYQTTISINNRQIPITVDYHPLLIPEHGILGQDALIQYKNNLMHTVL